MRSVPDPNIILYISALDSTKRQQNGEDELPDTFRYAGRIAGDVGNPVDRARSWFPRSQPYNCTCNHRDHQYDTPNHGGTVDQTYTSRDLSTCVHSQFIELNAC